MDIDDARHIQAAQGWIGLGLFSEAADELANVSLPMHDHPEFLETCWKIYAKFNRWTECWNIARAIVAQDDDNALGHIQLAYATERLEDTESAYAVLRPVADRISDSITIFYNLGCYASKLGRLTEAAKWLAIAFEKSEADDEYGSFYRTMAREDHDLEPLWPRIDKIGKAQAQTGGVYNPPRWSGG